VHRCSDVLRRHALQQVAVSTSPGRIDEVPVVTEGGEQDHPGGGELRVHPHPPGDLDPVQAGHPDVQQGDVRAELADQSECLEPVAGRAQHRDGVIDFQDHLDPLADQRFVVG